MQVLGTQRRNINLRLFEHPDFEQAVLNAAEYFRDRKLRPAIIEKDYYVSEALRVIATTSAQALPTLTPAALPPPLAALAPAQPGDPGAPVRLLASLVGIVAAASLLAALAFRHRLRRAQREV